MIMWFDFLSSPLETIIINRLSHSITCSAILYEACDGFSNTTVFLIMCKSGIAKQN